MPKPGQFAPRPVPPVDWTPDRDARGAAPDRGPRCPEPGCPFPPAAPGQPCREHDGHHDAPVPLKLESWQRAGVAYLLRSWRPGPGQRRAMAALLRDARRSNRAIAAELAGAASHSLVRLVRHQLEDAGLIEPYRAPSGPGPRPLTPLQQRIRAALLRDPARPNREVARECETNHVRVMGERHELEDAGEIKVHRFHGGPWARHNGHVDTQALQQAMARNLASMAIGQGGDPDVFSAELGKQLAQAAGTLLAEPGVVIPADVPVSDAPASDQPEPGA